MVNSNPETVSTDYDTSRTVSIFEPAHVRGRAQHRTSCERPDRRHRAVRRPDAAAISPEALWARGRAPIIGTTPESHRRARKTANYSDDAGRKVAVAAPTGQRHGRTLVRRGRDRCRIAHRLPPSSCGPLSCSAVALWKSCTTARSAAALHERYAVEASPEHPVLVDKFPEPTPSKMDVDAICDGRACRDRAGIMEHIEEAGVPLRRQRLLRCRPTRWPGRGTGGDSSRATRKLALELGVHAGS